VETSPRKYKPVAAKIRTARSGLDGHTAGKLDRGALIPDAKLDLHGLTEAAAHRVLTTFIYMAQYRGARLLLIVTGKGVMTNDGPFDLGFGGNRRGVLNAMVPRWLHERPLSDLIADQRSAHRRHGGDGALYVYLRKTRS